MINMLVRAAKQDAAKFCSTHCRSKTPSHRNSLFQLLVTAPCDCSEFMSGCDWTGASEAPLDASDTMAVQRATTPWTTA